MSFRDDIDGERFVADGVEEHNDLSPLVAQDYAFAPGLVNYPAIDGERFVLFVLLYDDTSLTVITKAAWTLIWFAKVVEQVGAAAILQFCIAAHHLNARPLK